MNFRETNFRTSRVLLPVILVVAFLAYYPGMTGGFAFDDYANILHNKTLTDSPLNLDSLLEIAWSGSSGPLKRPIAMISFALNHATTGHTPFPFKLTNLIIHLLNGCLVFALSLVILASFRRIEAKPGEVSNQAIALIVAAIWLLHPINVSSVLYVVQRMNSLSAFFSFIAVISYCAGRLRIIAGHKHGATLAYLVSPVAIALGALCKENAFLTVPLLALIEICFYRFEAKSRAHSRYLIGAMLVLVVLPALVLGISFFSHPQWWSLQYASRPFSMDERLFTEARVVWYYAYLILVPILSEFALYHDDFIVSTSLLSPMSTMIAIVALVLVVIAALANIRRYPLISFSILWFLIGHSLESSVIPLELIHEHRNYFPSFGIIFVIVYYASKLCVRIGAQRNMVAIACLVIALFGILTFFRASNWSDPVTLAVVEAKNHPNSHRSVYAAARVHYGLYLMREDEENYAEAIRLLEASTKLDTNSKRPYFALIRLAYSSGSEPQASWKQELLHRLQHTLFHWSETYELHHLVKCHAETPDCVVPLNDILQFFGAALRNPTLGPVDRSKLLVDLAIFYINEIDDPVQALAMLDEAVSLRPKHFQTRTTRVQILMIAKRYDRLAEEIKTLRSISEWEDRFSPPVDEIDAFAQDLTKLKIGAGVEGS